jgi:hypothetical protein
MAVNGCEPLRTVGNGGESSGTVAKARERLSVKNERFTVFFVQIFLLKR